MNEASKILFEYRFGPDQIRLFNNKSDLAYTLLTFESSEYRLTDNEILDSNIYTRQLNRMQSYISQIFSGTKTRKVTSLFKTSLHAILESKLNHIPDANVQKIYDRVVKSLEEENIKQYNDASNLHQQVSKEFIKDFTDSNFVAIFTSRPLELEANPNESIVQIRNLIVEGICNYFTKLIPQKKYRYNFPTYQIGILFWRRITYLLIKKLNNDLDSKSLFLAYMTELYSVNIDLKKDFDSKIERENILIKEASSEDEKLRMSVYHFFTYLNDNACFQVFESKEPVFIIPHLVLNPNESNNLKGYIFLEKGNNSIELYKFAQIDVNIWKEKVWDTIKANKNTKQIPYVGSIEDNIFLNFL